MHSAPDHNSIVLIRSQPGGQDCDPAVLAASAALGDPAGEVVAFFHGQGVEHACGHAAAAWLPLSACGLQLEVCSAAWQRRHDDELQSPFTLSTLVQLWSRIARGYRVVVPDGERGAARDGEFWLVVVSAAPADRNDREILELVLAGASLELPLAVLFRDQGCQHLSGGPARGWRQLVDYDLADLYCTATKGFEPDVPATPVDPRGVERLVARSHAEIWL